MSDAPLLKPRAVRRGDRLEVVAPGSPFAEVAFEAGLAELRRLGFEPAFDGACSIAVATRLATRRHEHRR